VPGGVPPLPQPAEASIAIEETASNHPGLTRDSGITLVIMRSSPSGTVTAPLQSPIEQRQRLVVH